MDLHNIHFFQQHVRRTSCESGDNLIQVQIEVLLNKDNLVMFVQTLVQFL
jgi:hypothetical protein